MGAVSGMVYDANGDPAARTVRAYRRDTGALLGEASSAYVAPVEGDENFPSVALLLHMDGANNSTTFTDSSQSPKAVSVFGGTKISTDESKFGGAAGYFDGDGDYLTVGTAAQFNFSTDDYCIEAWVYMTSAKRSVITATRSPVGSGSLDLGHELSVGSDQKLVYASYTDGGSLFYAAFDPSTFPLNQWVHVAVSVNRADSTVRLFRDGVLVASSGGIFTDRAGSALYVGSGRGYSVTTRDFPGYIDDLRITIGDSRYTADFTPPSSAHSDGGAVIGNDLGSYSIDCGSYSGEVNVICLDDDGGTLENDLILRTYPV